MDLHESQEPRRLRAEQLFQEAYDLQMKGELEQALVLYSESIEVFPTAEAHTFRGWTYSFMGDYKSAIEECLTALKIDPDYGNPYNDIGAYLIQQGKLDEAVPWLKRAASAPRYTNYCFPLFNLGRVHDRKFEYVEAEQLYRRSLEYDPNFQPAKKALAKLLAMRN